MAGINVGRVVPIQMDSNNGINPGVESICSERSSQCVVLKTLSAGHMFAMGIVIHALFNKSIDALRLLENVSIDESPFWIFVTDVESRRRMMIKHVHFNFLSNAVKKCRSESRYIKALNE